MKFIDKKISESSFQIYVLLESKEKKNLIEKIKSQLFSQKKEYLENQISIYKNISRKSNSDSSKEKLENFKLELQALDKNLMKFNSSDIEELLCQELMRDIFDHMESLKLIQVFDSNISIIGSFDDNNSLTLVYSFCYISYDYNLNYPLIKGSPYIFTEKDIDMIQTEILIKNKMYDIHRVEKVGEFSDIKLTLYQEDDLLFNFNMDINELEEKLHIDRSELIDLERGKNIVSDIEGNKLIIYIKEIYDKKLYEVNDDLIKKLNFENTKTVKEFRKEIANIFSIVFNIKSNVTSILDNMVTINDFFIDEFIYKYYSEMKEEELKKEYSTVEISEIKKSFITSYIFTKYDIRIDNYIYYITHEYDLFCKGRKREDTMTLEKYFNIRAPYYALYEFFKIKNLVTERSNNE